MLSRSALRARDGFPCAETRPVRQPGQSPRRETLALLAVEALLLVVLVLGAVAVVARSETARLIVAQVVGGGMA
jgi:propanediol utilization protein